MQEGQHPGVGSPPHSRGRRAVENIPLERYGITPAFAGKASPARMIIGLSEDHPRIRGEGRRQDHRIHPDHGSPPHSRGRPLDACARACESGITPAFAGKASPRTSHPRYARDHPRIRGEGDGEGKNPDMDGGSPPHSRGRRLHGRSPELLLGITPAFAGKADAVRMEIEERGDHPRIRGKAGRCYRLWARRGDHPRIRGEGRKVRLEPTRILGSPPHSRGRLAEGHVPLDGLGITPAFAGKAGVRPERYD